MRPLHFFLLVALAQAISSATASAPASVRVRGYRNYTPTLGFPKGNYRQLQQSRSSCIQNEQSYETNLLVTHLGDASRLAANNTAAIEAAFLFAYNDLVAGSCDPQFHNITQVMMDTETIQAVIPETTSRTGEFRIRYRISGQCDDCLSNSGGVLFGEPILSSDGSSRLRRNNIRHRVLKMSAKMSKLKKSKSKSKFGSMKSKSKSKSGSRSSKSMMSMESGSMPKVSSKSMKSKSMKSESRKSGSRQSTDDPCSCSSGGPDEESYVEAINGELIGSSLPGNYIVTSLAESKDLSCSTNSKNLAESTFLVQLDDDPSALTATEEVGLEYAFAKAYNDQSFQRCDNPYFRSVSEVQVERLSTAVASNRYNTRGRRRLQSTYGADSGDAFLASNVVKMTTVATCRDCPNDTALFANRTMIDTRRQLYDHQRRAGSVSFSLQPQNVHPRQQQQPESSNVSLLFSLQPQTVRPMQQQLEADTGSVSFSLQPQTIHPRQQQPESDTCFCSAKNGEDAQGAPPIDVFQASYNEKLGDMRSEDMLSNVPSVERTIEVREVQCNATEASRETTILLSVSSPTAQLKSAERVTLASSFKQAYNELIFVKCDTSFRKAVSVAIDEGESSIWLGRQPFTSRLDRQNLLQLRVQYVCRNCAPEPILFDRGEAETLSTPLGALSAGFNQEVQLAVSDTCYCPMEGSTIDVDVTVDVFRDVYTSLLASDGTSSVVEEVLEMDAYNCGNDVKVLSTKLFVEFNSDPRDLTAPDHNALEQKMRLVFNNLNFETCDNPHFRTALNFTLFAAEGEQRMLASRPFRRRTQDDSETLQKVNRTNLVMVSSSFECRFCSSTSSLLSWSDDVPLTFPALDSFMNLPNEAETISDTCYCQVNSRGESRSPTESEFMSALDKSTNSSGVSSVGVRDIVEVKEMFCPTERFSFQTEIFLRLSRNVASLSDTEIASIKNEFVETYNNLNFAYCDSKHFRKVLQVQLDSSQGQRRQQEEAEIFGTFNETDDDALMRMVVEVECRNCTRRTTLFANSSAIAGDLEVPKSLPNSPLFSLLAKRGRSLQSNASSCYCPSAFSSQERAPTPEEFLSIFNGTIIGLQVVGNLGEVQSLEEVIEVKQVECSDTVNQFASKIAVDLEGSLELLSKREKIALEVAFRDAYNDLSFSRCDSFHRSILAVDILPTSVQSVGRRQLQSQSPIFNPNTTTVTLKKPTTALFSVVGECRNCPVTEAGTFALFDDSIRRSLMSSEAFRKHHVFISADSNIDPRHLQSKLSGCLCPSNLSPDEPDAPTEDEFVVGYDSAVRQLNQEGLVSVSGVSDIESCERDVREISEIYSLGVTGDIDDSSIAEAATLAFNTLRTDDVCSAQVVNVEVLSTAQTKQNGDRSFTLEVVTITERPIDSGGAFSAGATTEDAFILSLNQQLAATASLSVAERMDFLSPTVRCSVNRASYSVVLFLDYQSDSPLTCQGEDNDDAVVGDDVFDDDVNFDDGGDDSKNAMKRLARMD